MPAGQLPACLLGLSIPAIGTRAFTLDRHAGCQCCHLCLRAGGASLLQVFAIAQHSGVDLSWNKHLPSPRKALVGKIQMM